MVTILKKNTRNIATKKVLVKKGSIQTKALGNAKKPLILRAKTSSDSKSFSTKNLGVSTGSIRIAVLHSEIAHKFSYRPGDRLKIVSGRRSTVAILDISDSQVQKNQIGLFAEVQSDLNISTKTQVTLESYPKPDAVFLIQKKLHGATLTKQEFITILDAIIKHELTDIEMTYFVSACYHHELTNAEIADLTQAMIETGNPIDFSKLYPKRPIVDKHCIGGVAANRTTALVVPILAAAGYIVPKTSSRSITSPAGTSDTIEYLANVSLTRKKIKDVVHKTNCCMVWGGALDLAPSDDYLIKVEHPISLDPVGQMIASILAKKKSVGSTHVLIDIPVGAGAKVKSRFKALSLKKKFIEVGKLLGIHVIVVLTDGTEPIGNGIGPMLEARDILWTLSNHSNQSMQLREKAIAMSAHLFSQLEDISHAQAIKRATQILDSNQAYGIFTQMLKSQGLRVTSLDPEDFKLAQLTFTYVASKSGKITHIDNAQISRLAKIAGAPFDQDAGIYLHKHVSDIVKKGDILYTVYTNDSAKLRRIKEICKTPTIEGCGINILGTTKS